MNMVQGKYKSTYHPSIDYAEQRGCPISETTSLGQKSSTKSTIVDAAEYLKTEVLSNRNECGDSAIYFFSKVPLAELPEDFNIFFRGIREAHPEEIEPTMDVPNWLDINKVIKGQQFAQKYYYAVNFAEMLSLMLLFSAPDGIDPLVYTEKSHTPFLAYKRYLSTVLRVKSWYETEFWKTDTDGYRNLKAVRGMHCNVHKRMQMHNPTERKQKTDLTNKLNNYGLWCPLIKSIREDMKSSSNTCPFLLTTNNNNRMYLNQFDMSMTQIGFYGILLLHYKQLGVTHATDEDLECFIHLWRYLGYMLGIKDEYNSCKGTYEEVKTRVANVMEYFIKPTMSRVTSEWEHMSRCAYKGIDCFINYISFEKNLLFLCYLLDFKIPTTTTYISKLDILAFKIDKFLLSNADVIPGMGKIMNYYVRWKLKEAQNVSIEEVKVIQDKCYYSS